MFFINATEPFLINLKLSFIIYLTSLVIWYGSIRTKIYRSSTNFILLSTASLAAAGIAAFTLRHIIHSLMDERAINTSEVVNIAIGKMNLEFIPGAALLIALIITVAFKKLGNGTSTPSAIKNTKA